MDLLIDVGFYMSARIRVRLLGVDTPEVYGSNACEAGKLASIFVKNLLPVGEKVTVSTEKAGKYGRWLAILTLKDGRILNDLLIDKGWVYDE